MVVAPVQWYPNLNTPLLPYFSKLQYSVTESRSVPAPLSNSTTVHYYQYSVPEDVSREDPYRQEDSFVQVGLYYCVLASTLCTVGPRFSDILGGKGFGH
eukprot:sb/3478670/